MTEVGALAPCSEWGHRFQCTELGYRAAQRHSAELDRFFSFGIDAIEKRLAQGRSKESAEVRATPSSGMDGVQDWVGLDPQALLTPYSELFEIVMRVGPVTGQGWVDLGAGYGRLGLVLGLAFPGVSCRQFELLSERVLEGQRIMKQWSLGPEVSLVEQDLTSRSFAFPEADVYLIYDYGSREAIQTTLGDLQCVARKRSIQVVGRGRASRHWIEQSAPWLSQVHEPRHFPTYSLYRS